MKDIYGILDDKEIKEKIGDYKDLRLLAQGEYHINYYFKAGDNKELVLRINSKSQMNLPNQIEYEFNTLKLLEKSGRTPRALLFDDSKRLINHGYLIMEYLKGRPLNYKTDLNEACRILGDIHNLEVENNNTLIESKNPINEILIETRSMFSKYAQSSHGDPAFIAYVGKALENMEDVMGKKGESYDVFNKSIINTELNSGNFLINHGRSYLIDWEKALYGDPLQDLAHFLAPTTSYWKTDIILRKDEKSDFIRTYKNYRNLKVIDEEKLEDLIKANCFRGISWCAMAYVEYLNPHREIKNMDTFKKIKDYMSPDFYKKYL